MTKIKITIFGEKNRCRSQKGHNEFCNRIDFVTPILFETLP